MVEMVRVAAAWGADLVVFSVFCFYDGGWRGEVSVTGISSH